MSRKGSRRRSSRKQSPLSFVLFCAAVLGIITLLQPARGQTQSPGAPPTPPNNNVADIATLQIPLAWMHEAKRNYGAVKDYSCTMVSRERVNNVLLEENVIDFKAKTQPFSVGMRWVSPKASQGQEVYFVAGRNDNKMRVRSNQLGKGKLLGFLTIDPRDPRALEASRHTITEAGIGNLIEQTLKHWTTEAALNKTQVKVGEYAYNGRACLRVETTRAERRQEFYCHRSVIYLDKESKMPIRSENYDWPRQGGEAGGDLLESFSYVNLRFNTGLTDQEFAK